MTVRIYQSTDASAPTLNGTVGSLITVLDAVLVNGYGSLTAAGWTKSYSGTNLAAYRPPSGNQLYLRVDDTAAQEGRMVGYETMSDVNTGTGPFPTNAQQSGGLYLRKSSTADATARPWVIVASATAIYIFAHPVQTALAWASAATTDGCGQFFFGDLISYLSTADAYSTMIIGATVASGPVGRLGAKNTNNFTGTLSAAVGHFVARAYTQSGASITVAKNVPGDYSDSTTLSNGTYIPVMPDVCNGNINLGVIEIMEQGSSCVLIRGKMPGAFQPIHYLPGNTGDIYHGTGAFVGRSWLIVNAFHTSSNGRMMVELTNNW